MIILGAIKIIQTNKHIPNFKDIEMSLDSLFVNKDKSFTQILEFFYKKDCNVLIFHQLLLIAQNLNFNDENENKKFCSFLKQFIADLTLDSKLVNTKIKELQDSEDDEFSFNKIDVDDVVDENEILSKLFDNINIFS